MIAATLIALGAIAAPASDDFEAFFQEFARKRDGIQLLEATFTQTTILPEETLENDGWLVYAKPHPSSGQDRRIVMCNDDGLCNIVDGRRGYEYEKDLDQVLAYDMEDTPEADIFFLGFDDDTQALREAYDVGIFEQERDERGRHGIVLRPKDPDNEDAFFKEVNLYLRDADFLPYRIHIVKEESEIVTEVASFKINEGFETAKTQLALPEGTKIIVNDAVQETVGAGGKRIPEPIQFGPRVRAVEETADAVP